MVCQAASQTRFRALKYENGIAGKPTIIVKIIACYQPLQDCQAEYFRHLLKPIEAQLLVFFDISLLLGISFGWMVKAEGSWLFPPHSTWQSPNFNCMTTSLDPAQLQCLPACIHPGAYMTSANVAMPGFAVQSIQNLKIQQGNESYGLPQCLAPHSQNFLPGTSPYVKDNLSMFSYGLGRGGLPNPIPGSQRRFLVFDQSGNEKRLIYSSLGPTVPKPTAADAKPLPGCFNYKEHVSKMDQTKLKLHKVSDENHSSAEESEMHEDTEEINALLYSDDEDYDEDGGGSDDVSDDDEVRSTGHSPILIKSYGTQEQVEEITEEVASSDGPSKRQKLIDGGYKKSSLVDTVSSVQVEGFHRNDDETESSYAIGQTQEEEMVSILGSKQFRKDKIRATLKILDGIIPGAKDKEPLLVLDEAIDYLKSLKLKAKTLGMNYH
ncbi:unnamed protein product [Dovyalis caffra]|uniref:Transcription factor bHLH143-like n=1 Tax=Dovyalis caffra TaxID=77055 RepID=A0AAV1SNM1_9ROSI|nr:unnamed protein product [Dovyalis caffra]